MPIYEYTCKSCKETIEIIQKINDPELLNCPLCGMSSISKIVSLVSFRLKGSGWYETDFKKSNDKKNLLNTEIKPEEKNIKKNCINHNSCNKTT